MSPSTEQKNTTVQAPDEPLIKLPMSKIIFYMGIIYLLFFLDLAARIGINPMYPVIQKEFNLTDPQVGLLTSVVLLGMSILVLPLSYIADRWSKSKLIALMAIVWSLSVIFTGFAKNFFVLAATRFGLGVGESSYAPTAVSLISTWFKKSQWGIAIGFFNTAIPLGVLIGSVFCGYMVVGHGWRTTLIVIGIPGLILGLLALMIPDYKAKSEHGSDETTARLSVKTAFKLIMSNKTLLIIVVMYGITSLVSYANTAWLPMFCIRFMDMTIPKAATITGIYAACGVLAYPIGGYIMDKWGKKDLRSRVWLPAACCLALIFINGAGFYYKSLSLIFLGAFVFSFIPTAVQIGTQELVPMWFRAVSYGILVFGLQSISMIGPTITGILSQGIGLQNALVIVQGFYIICFFGYIWAGMSYMKNYLRSRDEEAASGIRIGK